MTGSTDFSVSPTNLALDAALKRAGLSPFQLAKKAVLDPKTVKRWLDGETRPQAQTARVVAELLGVELHQLWPDKFAAFAPRSESTLAVSVYPSRADVPAHVWREHFANAAESIDCLMYGGTFLFDSIPGFAEGLASASERGVAVRILVGDPGSQVVHQRGEEEAIGDGLPGRCRLTLARLEPLRQASPLNVRVHRTPLYASLFRADDTILINHHIYGFPASDNPVLRLRRDDHAGLWARYRSSFDRIWNEATPRLNHPPAREHQ